MSLPSLIRDVWINRRKSVLIPSPEEDRIRRSKECTDEGVHAGLKTAAVAFVVSAIPTLAAVRLVPWAKANLNYTAQTLIISSASIATYFIVAEKTLLECAKRNNRANFDRIK